MNGMDERPTLRAPLGILLLIALLFAYARLAVWLFEPASRLHPLLQLPVWLLLGIAWIFPARPLTVWIVTGRWRVRRPDR
jgi:hypothetical protein